jgi:hypothetical protein
MSQTSHSKLNLQRITEQRNELRAYVLTALQCKASSLGNYWERDAHPNVGEIF